MFENTAVEVIPEASVFAIGISALPGMDSAGAISMRLLDVQNHSDEELADLADKIEIVTSKREELEDITKEIICTPYEEIAKAYSFPDAPEFISTPQELTEGIFALAIDEDFSAMRIDFDGGKYSEALIESFAAAYKHVVKQLLDAKKISDVDWLSEAELEKLQVIHDTAWEVVERPAYRILQDSAEKFPEHVAAIANGKSLTYRELNAAANRLGHVLQSHGVGVEKIVGVMLKRGIEVYIARQGVLKAGGAFLPMTPNYPTTELNSLSRMQKLIISSRPATFTNAAKTFSTG